MKTPFATWVLVIPLFLFACSDSGGSADGSVDGSPDAADGSEQDAGDTNGGDYGLEGDCGIEVVANLSACSTNGVVINNLGETLRQKARITFRPGLVRLLRNEERIEVDWIEQLEVGADGTLATPSSAGWFQRNIIQGTVDDGTVEFEFRQTFSAEGKTFELVFAASFDVVGGQPIHPVLLLNETTLDNPNSAWSLALHCDDGSDPRTFSSCGLVSGSCEVFALGIEGGDSLRFESCRHCPDQRICKADPAVIRQALFTSAEGQAEIEDPLQLCQSMAHHNWGTDILIAFDAPIGQTHGLYLHAMDEFYPSPNSFTEVHYLDADLISYQTKTVTSFEIVEDNPPVWGWISVYEMNDAWMNSDWTWSDGVRAYLAEAPHTRRALDHEKPTIAGSLVASAGKCSLYEIEWVDHWLCDPACDPDSQSCVIENEEHLCVDLPRAWNAGTIEVSLAGSILDLQPDELGRYATENPPAELFDAGDLIQVTASGDELGAFQLSAEGVAHLEIPDSNVHLTGGQATTVSWEPADPGSRVQIMLFSGPHHPAPPVASILCDAPDEDGQVEITAELVNGFLERTWVANWCSQALRYREASIESANERITLRVGSMRLLQLIWQ
ncbi:MAG: hypothetical protein JRF33_09580 [Deltaproteobacteria bacterium]|nr:hypothetical protein [Deltaproteobacteria bacterium]